MYAILYEVLPIHPFHLLQIYLLLGSLAIHFLTLANAINSVGFDDAYLVGAIQ